ncbi:hypothetical protein [Salinactinospora qingdaonensis]|uniref:MinD-like ATPase involved in chromosome partitioning or flagellar assembly n=1 Tax=Salinactinospora qingdaonensis TaxID=702744 RepID=A0ABP7FRN3_9ACTN
MRTVALFSLSGAPGVTTLGLALAAMWPREVPTVLVEADASGGDVAAWRRMPIAPGLVELAAAARPEGLHSQPPDLFRHTQVLAGGQRVCVAPVTAGRANGVVSMVAQHPGVLAPAVDSLVVLDLGRLMPRSAAAYLAAAADVALLVTTDEQAQLKRANEVAQVLGAKMARLGLVVIGDRESGGEIARAMTRPVWARIGYDRRGAEFMRGHQRLRRPHRRPLLAGAQRLADALLAQDTQQPVRNMGGEA